MAEEYPLVVRFVGDTGNLKAVIGGATRDIDTFKKSANDAGTSMEAGFTRGASALRNTVVQINSATSAFKDGGAAATIYGASAVEALANVGKKALESARSISTQRAEALAAAEAATAHHVALNQQYAAFVRAGQGSTAYAVALREEIAASNRATVAAREKAAAATTLNGAMGLLGGPAGAIMLAVSALGIWAAYSATASDATKELSNSVDNLDASMRRMSSTDYAKQIASFDRALEQIGTSNPAGRAKLESLRAAAMAGMQGELKNEETGRDAIQKRASEILLMEKQREEYARLGESAEAYGQRQAVLLMIQLGLIDHAETYGNRMAALARQAYPEATMSAEEYGEVMAQIAQQLLTYGETNEQYGERMAEIAREAYPEATQSAEEYANAQKKIAEEQQKQLQRPFENIANGLTSLYKTTFEDIFKNGLDGFKNFGERMMDMFRSMLAEIAATALRKQIILPIVASFGGAGQAAASSLNGGAAVAAASPGTMALGAGMLVGGFLLSKYLADREEQQRREDEERQRMIETRRIATATLREIGSSLRVLSGDSTQFAEDLRKTGQAVIDAGTAVGGAANIHDRVRAEQQLYNAIMARYNMERQALDDLKSGVATLMGQTKTLRETITGDLANVRGQSDYGTPTSILARTQSVISAMGVGNTLSNFVDSKRAETKAGTLVGLWEKWRTEISNYFNQGGGVGDAREQSAEFRAALAELQKYYPSATGTNRITMSESQTGQVKFGARAGQDTYYQQALNEYAESQRASESAFNELKNTIEQLTKDATPKAIEQLRSLRDETMRYYEAQKKLADLMHTSADNIGATLQNMRRGAMNPVDRVSDMMTEFHNLAMSASGLSGADLANVANRLNALSSPLLSEARNSYASGGQYQSIYQEIYDTLDGLQSRLNLEAPQDYQQRTEELLSTIGDTLDGLSQSLGDVIDAIKTASDASTQAIVAQLKELQDVIGPVVVNVAVDKKAIEDAATSAVANRAQAGESIVGPAAPAAPARTGPQRVGAL